MGQWLEFSTLARWCSCHHKYLLVVSLWRSACRFVYQLFWKLFCASMIKIHISIFWNQPGRSSFRWSSLLTIWQGSITAVSRRRHLGKVLYVKCLVSLPEVMWLVLGTYWAFDDSTDCGYVLSLSFCHLQLVRFAFLVLLEVYLLFDFEVCCWISVRKWCWLWNLSHLWGGSCCSLDLSRLCWCLIHWGTNYTVRPNSKLESILMILLA